MEKIIDIINFYKNIKNKFGLEDLISHIKVIYHKIWNGPDLYYFNSFSNRLILLNDMDEPEISDEDVIKTDKNKFIMFIGTYKVDHQKASCLIEREIGQYTGCLPVQ